MSVVDQIDFKYSMGRVHSHALVGIFREEITVTNLTPNLNSNPNADAQSRLENGSRNRLVTGAARATGSSLNEHGT